jgi:hypothetical protein
MYMERFNVRDVYWGKARVAAAAFWHFWKRGSLYIDVFICYYLIGGEGEIWENLSRDIWRPASRFIKHGGCCCCIITEWNLLWQLPVRYCNAQCFRYLFSTIKQSSLSCVTKLYFTISKKFICISFYILRFRTHHLCMSNYNIGFQTVLSESTWH